MPSVISSAGPSTRIPAWKRLGLKLKLASDPAENKTLPISAPQTNETKRKRAVEAFESAGSKRAKISSKTEGKSHASTPPLSSTSDVGRRKSVAFTSETKTEDGESAKQLYKTWVAEQKEKDPSFDLKNLGIAFSAPTPPQITEDFDENLDESERRVKRVRSQAKNPIKRTTKKGKPRTIEESQAKANGGSLQSALAYLTTFHDSKSTWKFNKIHQRNILKHTFDLDLIPSSYTELLYFYIAGLQGVARTQLRNAALEIKVKDQDEGEAGFPAIMADAAKRQEEYDAAVAEYVASILTLEAPPEMGYQEGVLMGLSDFAMKPRMEKRLRAERILAELGQPPVNEGNLDRTRSAENQLAERTDSPKMLSLNDRSGQKVRRKRKQRTAVVDLTSSSEDSSDSEDESSNEGLASRPIAVSDEDSSSSETSSSGSDDDEDDESSETSEDAESDEDESDSDSIKGT